MLHKNKMYLQWNKTNPFKWTFRASQTAVTTQELMWYYFNDAASSGESKFAHVHPGQQTR